jgi:hypothetical protein
MKKENPCKCPVCVPIMDMPSPDDFMKYDSRFRDGYGMHRIDSAKALKKLLK